MRSVLILLFLLTSPAWAQDRSVLSSEGTIFEVATNENGAVLTSRYPKAFWTNAGVNSSWDIRPATIYLGLSCDVSSPDYGDGTWGWANGGFWIDFDSGLRFPFPRQEHPVDVAGTDCSG
ncbi:MAG: hypothetical protein ACU0DW_01435 [Shimia sp.]